MMSLRALIGPVCALGLVWVAPAAMATQAVDVVGVSGQLSDSTGDVFTLDGGTAYTGLGSTDILSFSNARLDLTDHLQLLVLDGGVVDHSHIVTFRLLTFPNDPFVGDPGQFAVVALDSKGNKIGIDQVLHIGGQWEPNTSNDFWNTSFLTLNMPTISDFTVDFQVPEPSTWALMIVGLGGVGLALRRRRAPAVAV